MDLSFLETPRTHRLLPWIFPLLQWRRSGRTKAVYLTFDDGPTPGVTDRILEILDEHQAKAGFFCIGQAAERSPELVRRITEAGHTLGNHTYSHLSGWRCSTRQYLAEIQRCDEVLPATDNARRRPFRPPFGQLGVIQGLSLCLRRPVVFWDVNSMDYHEGTTPDSIARRVIDHIRPGSIVLLHDSPTAGPKTMEALPTILTTIRTRGWQCKAL